MNNYDYVPDRPDFDHPDVCGEDREPEDDSVRSSADVEAATRRDRQSILMPTAFKFFNASNEPCDMADGPCCCGAWHHLADWPKDVQLLIRETEPVPSGSNASNDSTKQE